MNSLVRQLKLHTLVGEKAITDSRIPLIMTFFDDLFDGMEMSILPDYDEENVLFHKDEVVYMEQDYLNDRLWCRWANLWSYVEKDLRLNDDDITSVVEYMVERHIKQSVGTPALMVVVRSFSVESYLKKQKAS